MSSSLRFPILLSIAAAIVTLIMKTFAYWLTGSVGLLSDAAESVINLSQERSQMQLSGKESAGKIADHAGLEVAWGNACVSDGGARGFNPAIAYA